MNSINSALTQNYTIPEQQQDINIVTNKVFSLNRQISVLKPEQISPIDQKVIEQFKNSMSEISADVETIISKLEHSEKMLDAGMALQMVNIQNPGYLHKYSKIELIEVFKIIDSIASSENPSDLIKNAKMVSLIYQKLFGVGFINDEIVSNDPKILETINKEFKEIYKNVEYNITNEQIEKETPLNNALRFAELPLFIKEICKAYDIVNPSKEELEYIKDIYKELQFGVNLERKKRAESPLPSQQPNSSSKTTQDLESHISETLDARVANPHFFTAFQLLMDLAEEKKVNPFKVQGASEVATLWSGGIQVAELASESDQKVLERSGLGEAFSNIMFSDSTSDTYPIWNLLSVQFVENTAKEMLKNVGDGPLKINYHFRCYNTSSIAFLLEIPTLVKLCSEHGKDLEITLIPVANDTKGNAAKEISLNRQSIHDENITIKFSADTTEYGTIQDELKKLSNCLNEMVISYVAKTEQERTILKELCTQDDTEREKSFTKDGYKKIIWEKYSANKWTMDQIQRNLSKEEISQNGDLFLKDIGDFDVKICGNISSLNLDHIQFSEGEKDTDLHKLKHVLLICTEIEKKAFFLQDKDFDNKIFQGEITIKDCVEYAKTFKELIHNYQKDRSDKNLEEIVKLQQTVTTLTLMGNSSPSFIKA